MPEQRDHQGQPHRSLRGCHRHDEKGDDLAVDASEVAPHGDEREVHRVEHDLNREQHRNDVSSEKYACRADGKENPGKYQVVIERDHQCSLRASTTAPTIATRINTDVASN